VKGGYQIDRLSTVCKDSGVFPSS